jgi:endonuclease V-like protein UPF0215 family
MLLIQALASLHSFFTKLITSSSVIFSQCLRGIGLPPKKFHAIKPEIRVVGIDDGIFVPHSKGFAPVIGVVFRGGYWLDGVMSTKVEVDGLDATEKIGSMVKSSPHYKQLRVIMLDGITFGGFNVVDIKELNSETGLPVIAVTRDKPNLKDIRRALHNLSSPEKRWKIVLNAGNILEVNTRGKNKSVYVEICGILEEDAQRILKLTSTRSSVPEALRVAHLVASGMHNV